MPNYFFHIYDATGTLQDDEGMVLPNLDAARTEAIQSAREILAETIRAGGVVDGRRFEVADESGDILFVVPFADVLKLHKADAVSGQSH